MFHLLFAAVGLVAVRPSPSPSPQPTAIAAPALKEVGRVKARGRMENLLGKANSAAEGNVGHAELEMRPILRPGELLETIPGVVISQHSGEGKANQYYLRGFNLDHGTDIAITIGGIPANMRTHAHGQGYSDINWLIPELVSYVHYRKGPYFADEGDFSTAGAVNMYYFDTLPHDIMTVGGGPYGQARVFIAASPKLGQGNLLYAAEYLHEDNTALDPDNYRKYNAFLKYSQTKAPRTSMLRDKCTKQSGNPRIRLLCAPCSRASSAASVSSTRPTAAKHIGMLFPPIGSTIPANP